MRKYGYTEIRTMSMNDLRALCIEKNWYTCGDVDEYSNLLTTAQNYGNITCDDLVELATDIKSHSETEYEITSIMFELARICISFFNEDE